MFQIARNTTLGITPPLKLRAFKLIAFDMDSTLINIECVDEIADFKNSLRRRVALLRGVTVADMDRVYTERLRLNPGATELIAACKAAGLSVLFSHSHWASPTAPAPALSRRRRRRPARR